MKKTLHYHLIHWDQGSTKSIYNDLLGEEPLSILLEGKPYSVVMRTPGEEMPIVAGFCLTEKIIDTPYDYNSLAFCDGDDTNVMAVTLTPSRRKNISNTWQARFYQPVKLWSLRKRVSKGSLSDYSAFKKR